MRWLILLILSVPLLVACMGSDDEAEASEGAGEFMKTVVETIMRGQLGRTLDMLHPEHQARVERRLFLSCNDDNSTSEVDITITETYQETINIPHVGEMETTAVTLNLSSDVDDSSAFLTRNTIQVDGVWVWFLGPETLAAYEAGECPE